MKTDLKELSCKLNSLAVFRGILQNSVVKALIELLSCEGGTIEKIGCYSSFVSALYQHSDNFSKYLLKVVLNDENFYIVERAQGKQLGDIVDECVKNELNALGQIARLRSEDLTAYIEYKGFLPKWQTEKLDFNREYAKRIENIGSEGYGMYSDHHVFMLSGREIIPVHHPDPVSLSELYGYELQRKQIIGNTLALLAGRTAQNTLLYGDAGTGKSSTVKAVVNEFSNRGLRLIEVTKEQLLDIPFIMEKISHNPLKFIIFIDDLSFTSDDACFGALKAMLEGTVSARSDNIAIYATSNRRHLVKESFADRTGDDVHRNDTIQEQISLSARFGLSVNFGRPEKKEYLDIVTQLAKKNGIYVDGQQLSIEAEAFALAGKGRSARTAKQFINQLINESADEK